MKEAVLRMWDERVHLFTYVRAFLGASRAYVAMGRWDDAVVNGQKAMTVAEEFSDNGQISVAAWAISTAYTFNGELDQAIEYGELGVREALTRADKYPYIALTGG